MMKRILILAMALMTAGTAMNAASPENIKTLNQFFTARGIGFVAEEYAPLPYAHLLAPVFAELSDVLRAAIYDGKIKITDLRNEMLYFKLMNWLDEELFDALGVKLSSEYTFTSDVIIRYLIPVFYDIKKDLEQIAAVQAAVLLPAGSPLNSIAEETDKSLSDEDSDDCPLGNSGDFDSVVPGLQRGGATSAFPISSPRTSPEPSPEEVAAARAQLAARKPQRTVGGMRVPSPRKRAGSGPRRSPASSPDSATYLPSGSPVSFK